MLTIRSVACPAAWLLAAACAAGGCGPATEPAPQPSPKAVALALQPYFRDLKTLRVSTAGGALKMLLDTGAGATLITPEVARQIGCTPFGRDVGHRMTGETVEFQRCESLQLTAGTWQRIIEPVAVFDVNRLLPTELPKLDGVLALDAFQGEVVTLDWRAGTLTVHAPDEAAAAFRASGVPLRIATGDAGRFFSALVPVAAARGSLWFLLDSGNIRGTLVGRHVVRDGRLRIQANGDAALVVGSRPAVLLRTEEAELDIDGALGTSYLLLGPVTLDLRGRKAPWSVGALELTKRPSTWPSASIAGGAGRSPRSLPPAARSASPVTSALRASTDGDPGDGSTSLTVGLSAAGGRQDPPGCQLERTRGPGTSRIDTGPLHDIPSVPVDNARPAPRRRSGAEQSCDSEL